MLDRARIWVTWFVNKIMFVPLLKFSKEAAQRVENSVWLGSEMNTHQWLSLQWDTIKCPVTCWVDIKSMLGSYFDFIQLLSIPQNTIGALGKSTGFEFTKKVRIYIPPMSVPPVSFFLKDRVTAVSNSCDNNTKFL